MMNSYKNKALDIEFSERNELTAAGVEASLQGARQRWALKPIVTEKKVREILNLKVFFQKGKSRKYVYTVDV
jgi:hypothetical protein